MKFSTNIFQTFFETGPVLVPIIIASCYLGFATTEAGTGPDIIDRNRLVWVGSGNQFGDVTLPSTISKTTTQKPEEPTIPNPGPVTCTQIGYMADPASSCYYYDCELNPSTGEFEATKVSCPAGTKFQVSPPQCVRF